MTRNQAASKLLRARKLIDDVLFEAKLPNSGKAISDYAGGLTVISQCTGLLIEEISSAEDIGNSSAAKR